MRFVTFAFQGKHRLGEEQDGRSFHWRDALGSARVARLGVGRSMAALRDAYDWDKGLEDQLVPLLGDLGWMRQQVEETFPGCQDFTRPGFDAEEVQRYRQNGWEGSASQNHVRHRG